MDPLTIAGISAAVGGVSGKLIEKAWDSGEKWLNKYFDDHHEMAQKKAKKNTLQFLNELAERVHRLEEGTQDDEKIKEKIESALQDPDVSALLKDTVIASSRTSNKEKHKIFARIVSERLRVDSEELLALVSTLACDAVTHLTPSQLRYLAVAMTTYHARPSYPFPPDPSEVDPSKFSNWYIAWLIRAFAPLLPIEPPLREMDFFHLEAVSCIMLEPLVGASLCDNLGPPAKSGYSWECNNFVEEHELGRELLKLWKEKLMKLRLTSAGRLIGIYVRDEIGGTTTRIHW